jgi:hypothetical protein
MAWQIVTQQKYIPGVPHFLARAFGAKHDYAALRDDKGNTVEEFHGGPEDGSFAATANGPQRNNPLLVWTQATSNYPPNGDPVIFADGKDHVVVASGSREEMKARWEKGVDAVKEEIARKKFLYDRDRLNGNTVNSTFLKAIGVANPEAMHGSPSRGFGPDLREAPTNNPDVEPDPKKRSEAGGGDDDLRAFALLNKPRSEWTPQDAAEIEQSPAFNDPGHPDHERAVFGVADYHRRRAAGLPTGYGPVHVRAYEAERGGKDVHVGTYTRRRPGE